MWREPEWLQCGLDAMRATFDVAPAIKEEMIQFLLDEGFWDSRKLTPLAARTRFNACLNPGKPDFFKVSELWALMKRFRRYHLWLAMGDDMGFDRPRQIPTEIRRQELLERLVLAQERVAVEMANLRGELARLDGSDEDYETQAVDAHNVRVHPAMREVGPKFSRDDESGSGGF